MFWIELDLTAEPTRLNEVAGDAAVPNAGSDRHALRTLLYVEDNPANLMLVEDLIARRPDIALAERERRRPRRRDGARVPGRTSS